MRIPGLVTRGGLELDLSKRDQNSDAQGKPLVLAVIFVAVLLFALFFYVGLRILRRTHPNIPAWFPAPVKRWWTKWNPVSYAPTPSTTEQSGGAGGHPRDRSRNRDRNNRSARRREPGHGVDRVTSVRSIMTLPEYRPVAEPDKERTIGREGERGGIDVVIEFPESITEEEERREEHMAALYEIRLARQLERAEARENTANGSRRNRHHHHNNSLGPAGGRNRDGSSSTSLAAALAAVQERDRKLSNVAYAEVGYARPDGTRVRADSVASDNLPLLSSGASMGHARSISTDSVEMFSARPSMETRTASGSIDGRRPVASMLDVGDVGDDRPPDYGSAPPSGPPPEYEQLHGGHQEGLGGGRHMQVPLLRVESASPEPPRSPTYPPQAR